MGSDDWRRDRRARRSRAAMMEAFERLAASRPPSKITVSALAGEAGVDRKTFYQHFGSMDGLLDARLGELVDEVLDAVERSRGDVADGASEMTAFFSAVAEALGERVALTRSLLGGMSTEELLARLGGPLERGVVARGLAPAGLDERTLRYMLSFELGGMLSLYRAWALDEGRPPLEEATAVARALTEAGIDGVAKG